MWSVWLPEDAVGSFEYGGYYVVSKITILY